MNYNLNKDFNVLLNCDASMYKITKFLNGDTFKQRLKVIFHLWQPISGDFIPTPTEWIFKFSPSQFHFSYFGSTWSNKIDDEKWIIKALLFACSYTHSHKLQPAENGYAYMHEIMSHPTSIIFILFMIIIFSLLPSFSISSNLCRSNEFEICV